MGKKLEVKLEVFFVFLLACEWYIISLMSHTCPSCCKVRCAVSELWSQSVSDALQTMLEETWGHSHNNIFY